jgi:hypothetical protein
MISMDDYKSLEVIGSKNKNWNSKIMQKGQYEELEKLSDTLLKNSSWPISLHEQISATQTSFDVEAAITS